MTQRLAKALEGLPGARTLAPVQANGVFVDLPETVIAAVRAKGWRFYNFVGATGVRFMCSWDTTDATVDAFAADLRAATGA
jgi:threonine aldolase